MENIEYAEHMMKMYKQEIVECKRKGNLPKQLKANGRYYAYRDMMHYMKEREQKKLETTAPELYQRVSDSGSLIIRRVKTKGGDDCKECVFNNASEDVHKRMCKPCTLMPSGFHYR